MTLTRTGCVTIDEASDPNAWADAIRWMLAPGRPMPAYDAAAYAFEQSANDEPPRDDRRVRQPNWQRIGFASALDAESAN